MNPIIWLLIGSVFLFIGSSRQAWFELQGWRRQLDSTLELAFDLVEDDQKAQFSKELAGLSGARRAVKEWQLYRRARKDLERQGLELLTPEELEMLNAYGRSTVSWAFIVVGSAIIALDPILELFFR